MTTHLIRTLAAATFLITAPAFAQDAEDHSVHHPGGETPLAQAMPAPAEPVAPASPATSGAPAASTARSGTPGTTGMGGMGGMMGNMGGMGGMMGNMGCMGMMGGTASGGMPMMMGGGAPGGPMPGGAMPGGPSMGMGGRADDSASTKAYRIANARMHAGMAVDYSGNADADFVRGMIAHHRGSIEMAETVLQFGEDPEIRKLAEGVIAAQEAEVAELRRWLLAHKGAAR